MYLSKFTDYSFRILIYLGNNPNKLFTVDELSNTLNLSTHHIKKIIYKLAKNGYISSSKGRNGGIKLGMDSKNINLGKLLEITEDNIYNKDKICLSKIFISETEIKGGKQR